MRVENLVGMDTRHNAHTADTLQSVSMTVALRGRHVEFKSGQQ